MKLRNKKTGEIVYATMMASYVGGELQFRYYPVNNIESTHYKVYHSIFEFDEEWEDAPEEPKVGYIIDPMEEDYVSADYSGYEESDVERAKELGIWFETEEEAEKAVERLRALTRLKDKGFKFTGLKKIYQGISDNTIGYTESPTYISFNKATEDFVSPTANWVKENWDDLQLIFGGEE